MPYEIPSSVMNNRIRSFALDVGRPHRRFSDKICYCDGQARAGNPGYSEEIPVGKQFVFISYPLLVVVHIQFPLVNYN